VLGAGLAGLACARRLVEQDLDVVVVEAADAVGGRVRSDRIDGFRVDRGFQLLNPAYPEVRRLLDLAALRLQPLPAAVVVARGDRRLLLADPRRTPPARWPRLAASAVAAGMLPEVPGLARWALHAARAAPARLLSAEDGPWGEALDRRRVRGPLRHAVLEPFLAGVLGEADGSTSRRFVELLLRSFVHGRPSLPWSGMQAVPDQLATGLPLRSLHLGVTATAVRRGEVTTSQGPVAARAVVVATDPVTAASLTGLPEPAMHGLTTFWHVAAHPPTASGALHVDGDRRGPVVNTVVVSHSARAYSPDARALVASTVLGDAGAGPGGAADAEREVRRHLATIYGADPSGWELLAVHAIPRALTAMPPPLDPRREVDLGDGLVVAGDHRDTASQQGALVSGRRAADAVLGHLGLPVPPRPPLEDHRAR